MLSPALRSACANAGRLLLDAVLPPLCLGCGEIVEAPGALCAACWQGFAFVSPPQCACCGDPFAEHLGEGALCAVCLVRALRRLLEFYSHESCGQCTPCREGVNWLKKIIRRLEKGNGKPGDIDLMLDICGNIKGFTLCPLGDAAAMPAEGFINAFRAEFDEHVNTGHCPITGPLACVRD